MNMSHSAAPNPMFLVGTRPSAAFMLPNRRARAAAVGTTRKRPGTDAAGGQAVRTSARGALLRFLQALIAARQTRAQRIVRQHLAIRSDATLLAAGYSREVIEAIRREASSGALLWF